MCHPEVEYISKFELELPTIYNHQQFKFVNLDFYHPADAIVGLFDNDFKVDGESKDKEIRMSQELKQVPES